VGAESNVMAFGDHGSKERLGADAGGSRPDQGGKGKEVVQVLSHLGSTSSLGALSLGGNNFDILEQVAQLPQKAFEAIKEVTAASKVPTADQGVPGGKGASSLEQIHNMYTPTHVRVQSHFNRFLSSHHARRIVAKFPTVFGAKLRGMLSNLATLPCTMKFVILGTISS
jgi:hypothetical protein